MSRNPRDDEPGSWHHVMNRGIARRSLFESRDDKRFFQACLARAVRRGQIEVHSWCILTTHFHLLLRSPIGEMSAAMRRVQNAYVRRFNRGRRRDGPLVRGRFRSKPVTSRAYQEVLIHYIDQNPVVAGIVKRPEEYAYGSARAYIHESGPPWMTRSWVEGLVCERRGVERYEPCLYTRTFGGGDAHAIRDLVERRIALPNRALASDHLDHLLHASSPRFLSWLRRKAELADASDPGLPVANPNSVRSSVEQSRKLLGDWPLKLNQKSRCGWQVLEAGLLKDMASASYREIGIRLSRTAVTASRLCEIHHRLIASDQEYAAVAADVASRALADLASH